MDDKTIVEDFLEWSGGFEPEDDEQIETYLELSVSSDVDEARVRDVLRAWMNLGY